MKPFLPILCMLLLGLATASTAGAMEDITNPPQCVRQGPPCGPEPLPCVNDEPCPVEAGCLVGDDRERCLVSVEWIVCVTEPCDAAIVCVGYGRSCTGRDLP